MNKNFFRGRRLRTSAGIRELLRETTVLPEDLIQPFFVLESDDLLCKRPIMSMPGQYQLGLEALVQTVGLGMESGLKGVILFGIPKNKDALGSQAYAQEGIIQQAIHLLKKSFPDLVVIGDVCLCEYTSHGHCGLIKDNHVDNDATLALLTKTAVSQAQAGADLVAPSDMMDGRIQAIRSGLDAAGYPELPIMSYAVKYASSYYGPFRDAAQSTPQFGDRKAYQMDPANGREAIREALADIAEGADLIMVKPALPYLDILRKLRTKTDHPLAAYQVSGEYAMIKAAAQLGWINEQAILLETLTSIKRAGAELIISYFTLDFLQLFQK